VRLEPARIERDNSLSMAELTRFDPRKGVEHTTGRRFLFGFTETEMRIDVRLRSWEETDPAGRSCAWITGAEVTLAPTYVVRVAREATRDPCFFKHVHDHELHHVRIEEDEARRLAGTVKARLRAMLAELRPIPMSSRTDANAFAESEAGRFRDIALALSEENRSSRERRHRDEVDIPSERTIGKVCGGIGARLAREGGRSVAAP
jgi:hypothetical protein